MGLNRLGLVVVFFVMERIVFVWDCGIFIVLRFWVRYFLGLGKMWVRLGVLRDVVKGLFINVIRLFVSFVVVVMVICCFKIVWIVSLNGFYVLGRWRLFCWVISLDMSGFLDKFFLIVLIFVVKLKKWCRCFMMVLSIVILEMWIVVWRMLCFIKGWIEIVLCFLLIVIVWW